MITLMQGRCNSRHGFLIHELLVKFTETVRAEETRYHEVITAIELYGLFLSDACVLNDE